MKIAGSILLLLCTVSVALADANETQPDLRWGNSSFYNLDQGEIIVFNEIEVELIQVNRNFNLVRVGKDTLDLKTSGRTLPKVSNGIRIFVAGNTFMKSLVQNPDIHGLVSKDALLCLSLFNQPLLDSRNFIFPVSFNDGFIWSMEEDSYLFSYHMDSLGSVEVSAGLAFNLHDARGEQKHWILALEDSRVVWVSKKNESDFPKTRAILLRSAGNPNIYYLYERLYEKNVGVKPGQRLRRGEALGTVWGDEIWGSLFFSVIYSETEPDYENRHKNIINFFPHIYRLYFGSVPGIRRTYTKGIVHFGLPKQLAGNRRNLLPIEDYSGKGWGEMDWNYLGRIPAITKGEEGNARLGSVLFDRVFPELKGPNSYFDYEINVQNGVYRVRAKLGDLELKTWQRIEFEDVDAGMYSLLPGEKKWTSEKVVQVIDGKLTIRIFVDEKNIEKAGISEIVFQRAY